MNDPNNFPLPDPTPAGAPGPAAEGTAPANPAVLAAGAMLMGGGILGALYGLGRPKKDGDFDRSMQDELEGKPLRLTSRRDLAPFPFTCPVCGSALLAEAGRRFDRAVLYVGSHCVHAFSDTGQSPMMRCPLRGLMSVQEKAEKGLCAWTLQAHKNYAVDLFMLAARHHQRDLSRLGHYKAAEAGVVVPKLAALAMGVPTRGTLRAFLTIFQTDGCAPESELVLVGLRSHSGPREILTYAQVRRRECAAALYDEWAMLRRSAAVLCPAGADPGDAQRAYRGRPGVPAAALLDAYENGWAEGIHNPRTGHELRRALETLSCAGPETFDMALTDRTARALSFARAVASGANGDPKTPGGRPRSRGYTGRTYPHQTRLRFEVKGDRLVMRTRVVEAGVVRTEQR